LQIELESEQYSSLEFVGFDLEERYSETVLANNLAWINLLSTFLKSKGPLNSFE